MRSRINHSPVNLTKRILNKYFDQNKQKSYNKYQCLSIETDAIYSKIKTKVINAEIKKPVSLSWNVVHRVNHSNYSFNLYLLCHLVLRIC